MRLEVRVSVWLLALFVAAAVVMTGGVLLLHRASLERQSREAGTVLAQSVKNSLQVSMLNDAPEDIRRAVINVKQGAYIEAVSVYGADGYVWVSSATEPGLSDAERAALTSAIVRRRPVSSIQGDLLTVFVPVVNQPECAGCHIDDPDVLGAVGVTLDERPLQQGLARDIRSSLLIAAFPMAIGLLASLIALRRQVLRPLHDVGETAERLASGDLQARLPDFAGAEFASVARAFNDMAARLQLQAAALERTVERLRSDLVGMEEIQGLLSSGAGLREVLSRTSAHLASALGAARVEIQREGAPEPEAVWGKRLRPKTEQDEIVAAAGGPVRWMSVPAMRGERTLAVLSAGWDPPRALTEAERDLLGSVAGLVAVAVENADLLERLRQEEESLEGALKKTLAAQEEERRRIARELHDDTSQILHALMMNIDLLETQGTGDEAVRAKLRAVKAMAEQAGRNLDKVMLDLRPALLDELGLVAALRWYVSQVREAWGMPIGFEVSHARRLPSHVEVATFRIAQEAVTNAVKYAEATHIDVSVEVGEDTLIVRVSDDGKGFDVSEVSARARTGEAAGLLGMRERTELLEGRLSIESRLGEGTSVTAEIPLPPADAEEVVR